MRGEGFEVFVVNWHRGSNLVAQKSCSVLPTEETDEIAQERGYNWKMKGKKL
jgi:hypothetical protein